MADDVAPGGRVAQRAADIGAVRQRAQPGRQRRTAAAAAGAGGEAIAMGVARGAEQRVGAQRARHGEFGRVELAQHDGPGGLFPFHHQMVGLGNVVLESLRGEGGAQAGGGETVLDADGEAVERAAQAAAAALVVAPAGFFQRPLQAQGDEGVEARVVALDACDLGRDQLGRAQLASLQQRLLLDGGKIAEIGGVHGVPLPQAVRMRSIRRRRKAAQASSCCGSTNSSG